MNAHGDHCLFRSNQTHFAFSTEVAGEVIERRRYTEIPRAPAGLLGAGHLRGEILPLSSLATVLHRQPSGDECPRSLIVLAEGDLRVAAGVDEVLAVQHFAPWEIHSLPPRELGLPQHLIRGVVRRGDSQTIILDGQLFLREVAEVIRADFAAITTDERGEPWPLQRN
jgi:chemotaxis signal transduction protein